MTMSHGLDGSDRVELYFYDELPPAERAAFETHLAGCAACRAALGELKEIREALAPMRAQAERSEFEWRAFMRRLDARLDAETAALAQPWRSGLFAAAGIAAMLVMAVATGALWQKWSGQDDGPSREFAGPSRQPGDAGGSPADRPTSREPAAELLDRAKIVLLGLANKDSGAVSADDWAYERSLAASLLPDTRLHRLAALESGDAEMASLLNDLEVLMLQASFAAEPDRATLARLQRYINRRDLLVRTELEL
jgi:hypothetical protein